MMSLLIARDCIVDKMYYDSDRSLSYPTPTLALSRKGGKIRIPPPFKREAKRGIGLCDGVEVLASASAGITTAW
jgi:hypothetical protein